MNVFKLTSRLSGLALLALLWLPLSAQAQDVIEGHMNGLNCAITGYVCPIDLRDPVMALEPDFVIQREDGEFFYIPNLDRAVKAQYFLSEIRVVGEFNERYGSITAEQLLVRRDGEFVEVWSQEKARRAMEEFYGPPA